MRDIDIRNELKATRLKKYYFDGRSRVVEELSLCSGDARVDLAVINGSLHGFEIKSEQDTLLRLPNQIEVYSQVFDYLSICTGPRHFSAILQMVPEWCGIILAIDNKKSLTLKSIRQATKNEGVNQLSITQLLWKEEVIKGLSLLGVVKGLSSKSKNELWRLFAETATPKFVSEYVRETLKTRANWRSELQPSGNDGYFPLSAKS